METKQKTDELVAHINNSILTQERNYTSTL